MNWFRENPFWSAFIAIAGGALLLAAGLVWWTKGSYEDAMAKYRESAAEQTRLESGNPYPSSANVGKMKTYLDNYKATLDKLKAELKTRMLTEAPLAPNEFQTRLRQAIIHTAENARNNRVKLPANFFLGFDEFVSSLPSSEDAPALGQELSQVQLLLNTIIEARVDAITAFHRVSHPGTATGAARRLPQRHALRRSPRPARKRLSSARSSSQSRRRRRPDAESSIRSRQTTNNFSSFARSMLRTRRTRVHLGKLLPDRRGDPTSNPGCASWCQPGASSHPGWAVKFHCWQRTHRSLRPSRAR